MTSWSSERSYGDPDCNRDHVVERGGKVSEGFPVGVKRERARTELRDRYIKGMYKVSTFFRGSVLEMARIQVHNFCSIM